MSVAFTTRSILWLSLPKNSRSLSRYKNRARSHAPESSNTVESTARVCRSSYVRAKKSATMLI